MKQKSIGVRIAPYAIGIICFILPFIQISCDGEKMMSLTGVQLVTGSEMQGPMSGEVEKIPPNVSAVIALVALGLGVAFAFSITRGGTIFSAISGGVALVALGVLKTNMDAEILKETAGMPISVEYMVGFWGAGIASLTGGIMALMRVKELDESPPDEAEKPEASRNL